jgi:hypothetical protein
MLYVPVLEKLANAFVTEVLNTVNRSKVRTVLQAEGVARSLGNI